MRAFRTTISMLALALSAVACGDSTPTAARAPQSIHAQVFTADSSCAGGCDAQVLAYQGQFSAGVHYVDLGQLQNSVLVYLHSNVLTGGGAVQFVVSTDCSTWTSYDPATEQSGTAATLPANFTLMGFDIGQQARCVGVRNTASMDGTVLLWAIGI